MSRTLRQNWDTVNDCASVGRISGAKELIAFNKATSADFPEYRCKFVTLPGGQYECSVTPANSTSVINARMGFNPLLDCARKIREPVEQEERDTENRQRAGKRAKQKVRHLVKASFADHMLTFAYRETMLDREKLAKDWKEFVRLFRVLFPSWTYTAVIEKCDSEKTTESHRGTFHIHVAVKGKQKIKWLLRCWLLAIGQSREDVTAWLAEGKKLGVKSLGSVNVEPPKRLWGGMGKLWKAGKLAEYLSKYIGKEFEDTDKFAKKYWHSKNIEKPVIERFWLKAKNYREAIIEAHDLILNRGADNMSIWNDYAAGVVWITGEVDSDKLSWEHCKQGNPDLDFLE